MNKVQLARYNADKRAQDFCTKHNDDLITVDEYAAEKSSFDDKVKAVKIADEKQASDTTVITDDKALKKQKMVETVYKYELRGNIKAHQLGSTELELSLDKPESYVNAKDGNTAWTRAKDLKNIMKGNIDVLTNLTDANITEMEVAIDAYEGIMNVNKEAVSEKKATATDVITPLLDEADVPKGQIEKIVASYFPTYLEDWMVQTKVGKAAGIKHLNLVVKYFDSETNVVLAKVKTTAMIGDKKLIKYSTKKGYSRYKGMEHGNADVVSELAGYVTDTKTNVGISDEVVKMEIKMKKL